MKKHILSFIGTLCALVSFLFLSFNLISTGDSSSASSSLINDLEASDVIFFLLIAAITFSILSLVTILEKKENTSLLCFRNSLFVLPYTIGYINFIYTLNKGLKAYSSLSYTLSFVAYLIAVLLIASLILCAVEFAINYSKENRSKPNEDDKFELIYKYKKLMDDGIINEEEFKTYKENILS